MDKEIAEYITRTVEKIDPEISVIVTQCNAVTVPIPVFNDIQRWWEEEDGSPQRFAGLFRKERIPLEHKIPGGSLGYGEQSRTLAIKWDD